MKKICNTELCTGCSSCFSSCPSRAIIMKKDCEGFIKPVIKSDLCTNCGTCVKKCPINSFKKQETIIDAYAIKSNDDNIRMNSSSGGLFSHLSKYIIDNNGYVVGAAFSKDYTSVHHVIVDSNENLWKLYGSKYVQSDLGTVFYDVEKILKDKKLVLFTGTPCQIEGLKSFLEKDYENLFCIDIVCHGVPSQYVWNKYLDRYLPVSNVRFRDKSISWEKYSVYFDSNGASLCQLFTDNPYMQLYLKNFNLRMSCYNCNMKSAYCNSDISLGDLWGSNHFQLPFNDDMGISFFATHTSKGDYLLDQIKKFTTYKKIDVCKAIKYNSCISNSVSKPKQRKYFYNDLEMLSFADLSKKYLNKSLVKKIKITIKKLVRK